MCLRSKNYCLRAMRLSRGVRKQKRIIQQFGRTPTGFPPFVEGAHRLAPIPRGYPALHRFLRVTRLTKSDLWSEEVCMHACLHVLSLACNVNK